MHTSKFIAAYSSCLFLLSLCVFGLFNHSILTIPSQELLFYSQISSVFIGTTSFILLGYYSGIFVREKSTLYLNSFIKIAINLDANKISIEDMDLISNKLISDLNKTEKNKLLLYTYIIPSFVLFLTFCILIFLANKNLFPALAISVIFITIAINSISKIIRKCNILKHKTYLRKFSQIALLASRGIQFYSAQDAALNNFYQSQKIIKNEEVANFSRSIFIAFWSICGLFCAVCILYIAKEDYISDHLFDLSNNSDLFYSSIFSFIIFSITYKKHKNIIVNISYLENYTIKSKKKSTEKPINDENMFLAFHKVCFQEPTKATDFPILNNISFSILPGEFVSITGENSNLSSYIFDLILKYYKPQSGNIFIGGTAVNNINTNSLRASISFFSQDFGLIDGTIFDNLVIVNSDKRKILKISEKVDLRDALDFKIFDENGKIQLSQEILIRIQIARSFLRNTKILLIESPKHFESKDNCELFNNFVDHISKRKTVIISTNSAPLLIYSDKILYLGNEKSIFGQHAELINDSAYQNHINHISKNV